MKKYILPIALICTFLINTTIIANDIKEKTLIIFSASWCKFCHKAKDDMNNDTALSEAVKLYDIVEIDFDVDKDIVSGYNIKSIPTFITFENGKESGRLVGYRSKQQLLEFLK